MGTKEEITSPVREIKLQRGEKIMFKKNAWIAGLLAALAILFVGCLDPLVEEEEDPNAVETVVVDLQEIIKDLPPQVFTSASWNAVFDGTPFRMCGEDNGKFEIVAVAGGKKAIKISNISADWGVGLDARHFSDSASKVVGINFKAGDVVNIKGKVAAGSALIMNVKGQAGEKKLGGDVNGWSSGTDAADFDDEVTVTADDVTEMRNNSFRNSLRIHRGSPAGSGRMAEFQIEEFKVTGLRSAGDVEPPEPEPEPPYAVTDKGAYTVPTATGREIYLDLNEMIKHALTAADTELEASVDATKLTVVFNKSGDTIFIPFTAAQKTALLGAANDYDVTIVGTGTVNCRWTLGPNATANWNVTGDSTTSGPNYSPKEGAFSAGLTQNHKIRSDRDPANLNGFILQARNWAADATEEAITITITSIKIAYKLPVLYMGDINLVLNSPVTGATAQDKLTGTQWVGTVTWTPALTGGKFAGETVYAATIVISPAAGYTLFANVVTAKDNSATDILLNYNPETGIVLTKAFAATDSRLPLATGKLFDLADWLPGKTSLSSPLSSGGGSTYTVDSTGITVEYGGPSLNNWETVAFNLSQIDDRLDPATFKIRVVVTGKVLEVDDSSGKGKIKLGAAADPYNDVTGGSTGELEADDEFTISVTEIQSTFAGGPTIRIQGAGPSGGGNRSTVKKFIVTGIEIYNDGAR